MTPWEAALGAKVPVDCPGGEAKVRVPAGTVDRAAAATARSRYAESKGRPGDLYAVVRIMVPKQVDASEERELFEELGASSTFDPRQRP